MQLPASTQATPAYTGGSAGFVTFYNPDAFNPVYIGRTSNIKAEDLNTDPLPPQSSVTYEGDQTLYAVFPTSIQDSLTVCSGATTGTYYPLEAGTQLPTAQFANGIVTVNGGTLDIATFPGSPNPGRIWAATLNVSAISDATFTPPFSGSCSLKSLKFGVLLRVPIQIAAASAMVEGQTSLNLAEPISVDFSGDAIRIENSPGSPHTTFATSATFVYSLP